MKTSKKTLISRLRLCVAAGGLSLVCAAPLANPLLFPGHLPGFVVLAEQRYDPAVQRFMAEQSLRAMPLQNGQLYFVYPVNTSNAYVEQMQIRYLEVLLQKQTDKAPTNREPSSE